VSLPARLLFAIINNPRNPRGQAKGRMNLKKLLASLICTVGFMGCGGPESSGPSTSNGTGSTAVSSPAATYCQNAAAKIRAALPMALNAYQTIQSVTCVGTTLNITAISTLSGTYSYQVEDQNSYCTSPDWKPFRDNGVSVSLEVYDSHGRYEGASKMTPAGC
jgi:hypothetical protein